jgi:hypothetical protein
MLKATALADSSPATCKVSGFQLAERNERNGSMQNAN